MQTFSELKKILAHSSIYSMASIITKVVGFLMLPVYTRYLSPSDYGVLNLLDLSASLLAILVGLGLRSALFRFYFDEDEEGRRSLITTALIAFGAISGAVIALFLPFSNTLSKVIVGSPEWGHLFFVTLVTLWFNLLIEVGISYILIQQRSAFYLAVTLVRLFTGVTLNVVFLVVLLLGVKGMIYSSLLTNLPLSLFLMGYTFRRCGFMVSPRQFRAVLRFGLPLIPADLGRFAITYADHFLIRRFVDLRWTGIYSLSYQFGILLSIFVTQSFIRSWHVKRFELLKMGKEKDVSLKVFLYFHFVLLFFALLLSALIRDVVRVMLHPDFYDVHLLVPLIVLGYILQAPYYFFDFGIYIEKKTSYFSFILLSTAGINIALNLILIPAVHATGAAVATDISLLYMTLSCYFISRRFYSLPYEFGKVLAMFLIALPLFLLSLLFRVESIPLSILLNLAISLAYPPIILFSGLLPGEAKAAVLRWIRGSGVKLN